MERLPDEMLAILRCPQSQEKLRYLRAEELEDLNQRAERGALVDGRGRTVERDQPIEQALITLDERFAYLLQDGIANFYLDDRLVLQVSS